MFLIRSAKTASLSGTGPEKIRDTATDNGAEGSVRMFLKNRIHTHYNGNFDGRQWIVSAYFQLSGGPMVKIENGKMGVAAPIEKIKLPYYNGSIRTLSAQNTKGGTCYECTLFS